MRKVTMQSASIREWLVAEGLAKYVERFETSRIGVDVLGELTERDVPDLGIALGDRQRPSKAVWSLIRTTPSTVAPLPSLPTVAAGSDRRQLTVLFCDLARSTALSTKSGRVPRRPI